MGTEVRTRPCGKDQQLIGGVESSDAGSGEERLGNEARGGGTEERHYCRFRCESAIRKGCCLKLGDEWGKLRHEFPVVGPLRLKCRRRREQPRMYQPVLWLGVAQYHYSCITKT